MGGREAWAFVGAACWVLSFGEWAACLNFHWRRDRARGSPLSAGERMAGLSLGKGRVLRFLLWGRQNVWVSPFFFFFLRSRGQDFWAPAGGRTGCVGSPFSGRAGHLGSPFWRGGQVAWDPLGRREQDWAPPWVKQDAWVPFCGGGQDAGVPLHVKRAHDVWAFLGGGRVAGADADAWIFLWVGVRKAASLGSPFFGVDAGHLGFPFGEGPHGWVSRFWKAGHLGFCDNWGIGQLGPTSVLRGQIICVLP